MAIDQYMLRRNGKVLNKEELQNFLFEQHLYRRASVAVHDSKFGWLTLVPIALLFAILLGPVIVLALNVSVIFEINSALIVGLFLAYAIVGSAILFITSKKIEDVLNEATEIQYNSLIEKYEPTNSEVKLGQAYQVIGYLLNETQFDSIAGQAALDYFSTDVFDEDFLPWPKQAIDLENKAL